MNESNLSNALLKLLGVIALMFIGLGLDIGFYMLIGKLVFDNIVTPFTYAQLVIILVVLGLITTHYRPRTEEEKENPIVELLGRIFFKYVLAGMGFFMVWVLKLIL